MQQEFVEMVKKKSDFERRGWRPAEEKKRERGEKSGRRGREKRISGLDPDLTLFCLKRYRRLLNVTNVCRKYSVIWVKRSNF